MLQLRHLCVALICVFSACIAEEAPASPKVMHYVQDHLPKSGVLKHVEGFLYVDIDDAYIHKLITFIEEEGYEEPQPQSGTHPPPSSTWEGVPPDIL